MSASLKIGDQTLRISADGKAANLVEMDNHEIEAVAIGWRATAALWTSQFNAASDSRILRVARGASGNTVLTRSRRFEGDSSYEQRSDERAS